MITAAKSILSIFLTAAFVLTLSAQNKLNLQVPSPDWQDQIIYFVMTDRFNDGNPENNDQGFNEYNPKDSRKFSGGDLKGINDKIDYIKNLGATAVWITPPVANQWWDPVVQYGGYHGYWGVNFKELDKHFGTLNEYKELSDTLHDNGMYLIQDIVPNHTGNFFDYKGTYNSSKPEKNFVNFINSSPVKAPTQYPFNLNNVHNEKDRKTAAYHWTPIIKDSKIVKQRLTYQLANLDDINTGNPLIRKVLKDSYGYWIKEVGVDAFRIDTVIYVEHDFWNDFLNGKNGMNEQAISLGKNNFFTFGEAFIGSKPMKANGEKEISKYIGNKEKPEMSAVLNFPLYFTSNKVFAEGQPTSLLSYRLKTFLNGKYFKNPYIIPKFIDNHDVPRFLSKGSIEGLKQAIAFLMTTPGIPVIYYGTEQGFKEQRASMFKTGWGSENEDHFDENSELYKFTKKMIKLRKSDKIFSRGKVKIIKDSNNGPGIFAFSLNYKSNNILVVFNTASHSILVPGIKTDYTENTLLKPVYSNTEINNITVGEQGVITTVLPAKSIILLKEASTIRSSKASSDHIIVTTAFEGKTLSKQIKISGTSNNSNTLLAVIDGNIDNAVEVPVNNNKWKDKLTFKTFSTGKEKHNLVIYSKKTNICTKAITFYTDLKFPSTPVKTAKTDADLKLKKYGPPHDKSYIDSYLKIDNVKIFTKGTNLKVAVKMKALSQIWNPQNGFDHVCFNIYIDLPNKNGCSILPRINSKAPNGFNWDYMSFSQGWTNGLYSAKDATLNNWGKVAEPAPRINVDKTNNTINFIYTPQALGYPETLKGTKVFITTWDYDNGYRKLSQEGGPWSFSGGNTNDPLIFDYSPIITIE